MSADSTRRIYRCHGAAVWLPRTLAGTVLTAITLWAFRLGVGPGSATLVYVRAFLVTLGAFFALWIVRRGSELRHAVRVTAEGVEFLHPRGTLTLPFREISGVSYQSPFSGSRHWLPAAVLIDRSGRRWRLSALLEGGDGLIDELLAQSARKDLASWTEVRRVRQRMRHPGARIVFGYVASAIILVAGVAGPW